MGIRRKNPPRLCECAFGLKNCFVDFRPFHREINITSRHRKVSWKSGVNACYSTTGKSNAVVPEEFSLTSNIFSAKARLPHCRALRSRLFHDPFAGVTPRASQEHTFGVGRIWSHTPRTRNDRFVLAEKDGNGFDVPSSIPS
jgi:hypothetical protein